LDDLQEELRVAAANSFEEGIAIGGGFRQRFAEGERIGGLVRCEV
jgi:hypothetical protein